MIHRDLDREPPPAVIDSRRKLTRRDHHHYLVHGDPVRMHAEAALRAASSFFEREAARE
jgi:hypothetical protein